MNQMTFQQMMSQFFKDKFNVTKKLQRKPFFIAAITYMCAVTIVMRFIIFSFTNVYTQTHPINSTIAFIVPLLIMEIVHIPAYTAMIRRFNDIGFNPKISLGIGIFIILSVLILAKLSKPLLLVIHLIVFAILFLPTNFLLQKK